MIRKIIYSHILTIVLIVLFPTGVFASRVTNLNVEAPSVGLMDARTGAILYEKDADKPMHPASITKLMTAYVVFEHIERGNISLDTKFFVSQNAFVKGGHKTGGSTSFLNQGEMVSVQDLLLGLIVQSGNDATIALAEGVAGSEEEFVKYMNLIATDLGMKNTKFNNSTGWPDKNHYSTARDLMILSAAIITKYPQYQYMFVTKSFEYNGVRQPNRNTLLRSMDNLGVTGLKTGHTADSGYSLAFSSEKDGMLLVGVVIGLNSTDKRTTEAEKVLKWGYLNFESKVIYSKGDHIADIKLWESSNNVIKLKADRDIVAVYPVNAKREDVAVYLAYRDNIKAPISKNDIIAVVYVDTEGEKSYSQKYLLKADKNYELKEGFFSRFLKIPRYVYRLITAKLMHE